MFRNKTSGMTISSTFTAFYAKGTLKGTAQVTAAPQPDGSVNFSGSAKVTDGTGVYEDATGRSTVTGTLPQGSTVVTLRVKGSLTY